jgi:hypothetical protein
MVVPTIATLVLLTSLPIFTGCTTSGYLNVVNPYNNYTPFRKSAFRTMYSNVSWEQKLFEGENEKYTTASCEDNYKEFTKLSFIQSITGLEREGIGEIHDLERVDTNICRFYAVLTFTFPARHPTRAGQTKASYYYFYWREHGNSLIVYGNYDEPWKSVSVYAKDTLEAFLER